MSDRTPEEILTYCNAATPGPWEVHTQDEWGYGTKAWIAPLAMGQYTGFSSEQQIKDKQFCANARTDLPRLAEECKRLRERLRWYRISLAIKEIREAYNPTHEEIAERCRELEEADGRWLSLDGFRRREGRRG